MEALQKWYSRDGHNKHSTPGRRVDRSTSTVPISKVQSWDVNGGVRGGPAVQICAKLREKMNDD